ncbi:LysM peptidoglycan-binding domain-containing protein [Bacillus sp. ISL-47]|nr:LysM peptidoglycan-binding domain-containing protein [Bacillus sp. ISL-47]
MQTRKERILDEKRKQAKSRRMKAASTAFAAAIAAASLNAAAKDTHALVDTYTVQKGDTLYRISKEHDMTVKELKAVNKLKSNIVYPGQKLEVRTERHTEETFLQHAAIYTVVPGDTLWGIAKRYNMSVTELKTLNNLKSDMVLISQKLIIKEDIAITTANIVGAADNFTVEFKTGDDFFRLQVPYGTAQSYQKMAGEQVVVAHKNGALINIQ